MRTIKEWLSEIDKADNEHNPRRRADLSDALVIELRGIFGTDDRLTEICQAERDGRLVVLPCKVGDTIYRIDIDPLVTENEIECFNINNIVVCDDGDILLKYDAYDGVICTAENIINGTAYLDYYLVFLTREEAEKALKGGAE